jgi:hypothetical protein
MFITVPSSTYIPPKETLFYSRHNLVLNETAHAGNKTILFFSAPKFQKEEGKGTVIILLKDIIT